MNILLILVSCTTASSLAVLIAFFWQRKTTLKAFSNMEIAFQQLLQSHQANDQNIKTIGLQIHSIKESILQQLLNNLNHQQEGFYRSVQDFREQITLGLQTHATQLTQSINQLNQQTDQRLVAISQQVEKRLYEGFEKTTSIFTDVVKRLALIDEAQKKITELSSNVVSLQEILVDKKARGAFGEVQLSNLIHNMIPENHFSMQHTLSNGKRVDCLLLLPDPTGNVAIDAKFPLETYRRLISPELADIERKSIEQQFRIDIRKHIQDVASKYILPGETADGAVLFIPAEAIFAEIHSRFPELVEEAQKARVWLVSPTTLMAVLTTARAVLKDAATRKQVHLIQEHLHHLSKDFMRFEQRMMNLARHIDQANSDVKEIQISAEKITQRFTKIEKVELNQTDKPTELV